MGVLVNDELVPALANSKESCPVQRTGTWASEEGPEQRGHLLIPTRQGFGPLQPFELAALMVAREDGEIVVCSHAIFVLQSFKSGKDER
jgi:hypothetical protein